MAVENLRKLNYYRKLVDPVNDSNFSSAIILETMVDQLENPTGPDEWKL